MMNNTIETLDYGFLPIASSDKWLKTEVIDIIELSTFGEWAEVRQTLNGSLVALVYKE